MSVKYGCSICYGCGYTISGDVCKCGAAARRLTMNTGPVILSDELNQLRTENSALKAELAEAKQDAERLTWLEHQNSNIDNPDAWCITRCDFTDLDDPHRFWVGSDLRSAIDAAMKGK